MPGISKIGTHIQGFDVYSISLESDILQAEILDFGATLKDLRFSGFENSMVLGYASLQDYFSDKNYLGVIIGRYANRISNGQYFFEAKEFNLSSLVIIFAPLPKIFSVSLILFTRFLNSLIFKEAL